MIHVVEHTTTAGVRLSFEDYEYLNGLTAVMVDEEVIEAPTVFRRIAPTRERDVYRVQAGPYVGRLGLPSGDSIDIRSRFEFDDFVALLRAAGRLPSRVDLLAAIEDTGMFIVDALVYAFVREVEALAGRGLTKGYVARRRNRPPYAGRPDLARHVARNAARPERIATIERTITADIPVNRALRRGFDALRAFDMAPAVAGRLARLSTLLNPAARSWMTADDTAALAANPDNRRYRDALLLAEVALRGRALTPTVGALEGSSFLFYMPGVWQACVVEWVRERYPERLVAPEHRFAVTDRGGEDGRADVAVFDSGELIALFDAKYKRFGKRPNPEDVYQMVAYLEALGLDEATLVYPEAIGEHVVRCGRRVIRSIGLPPNAFSEPR